MHRKRDDGRRPPPLVPMLTEEEADIVARAGIDPLSRMPRMMTLESLPADPTLAAPWTADPFEIAELKAIQERLLATKCKLDGRDLSAWGKHTSSTRMTGMITVVARREVHCEMMTTAWCKMYEMLEYWTLLAPGDGRGEAAQLPLYSVHLCEAPGGFVSATNHWLRTRGRDYGLRAEAWEWCALSLNPYYEGNDLGAMVDDDRLMLETRPRWFFGVDDSGDVRSHRNIRALWRRVYAETGGRGARLVTADGSISAMHDPGRQEEMTAALHYAELVAALGALAVGGAAVLKMFTLQEHTSVGILALCAALFRRVHICKPVTSKAGNSEIYIVARDFRGIARDKLESLLQAVGPTLPAGRALVGRDVVGAPFLRCLARVSDFFAMLQEAVIEGNIRLFDRPSQQAWGFLRSRRTRIAHQWLELFRVASIGPGEHLANAVARPVSGARHDTGRMKVQERDKHTGTQMDRDAKEQRKQRDEARERAAAAALLADLQKPLLALTDGAPASRMLLLGAPEDDAPALQRGQLSGDALPARAPARDEEPPEAEGEPMAKRARMGPTAALPSVPASSAAVTAADTAAAANADRIHWFRLGAAHRSREAAAAALHTEFLVMGKMPEQIRLSKFCSSKLLRRLMHERLLAADLLRLASAASGDASDAAEPHAEGAGALVRFDPAHAQLAAAAFLASPAFWRRCFPQADAWLPGAAWSVSLEAERLLRRCPEAVQPVPSDSVREGDDFFVFDMLSADAEAAAPLVALFSDALQRSEHRSGATLQYVVLDAAPLLPQALDAARRRRPDAAHGAAPLPGLEGPIAELERAAVDRSSSPPPDIRLPAPGACVRRVEASLVEVDTAQILRESAAAWTRLHAHSSTSRDASASGADADGAVIASSTLAFADADALNMAFLSFGCASHEHVRRAAPAAARLGPDARAHFVLADGGTEETAGTPSMYFARPEHVSRFRLIGAAATALAALEAGGSLLLRVTDTLTRVFGGVMQALSLCFDRVALVREARGQPLSASRYVLALGFQAGEVAQLATRHLLSALAKVVTLSLQREANLADLDLVQLGDLGHVFDSGLWEYIVQRGEESAEHFLGALAAARAEKAATLARLARAEQGGEVSSRSEVQAAPPSAAAAES